MNMYIYDEIYVEFCQIGQPAVIRIVDYTTDGAEHRMMTPSPVVSMSIGDCKHVSIETEMSVIQTTAMNIMVI